MFLTRFGAAFAFICLCITMAQGDVIYNIQLSPKPTAVLQFNQLVNITFDYETGQSDGIFVVVQPISGDVPTPTCVTHDSTLYPTGSGSGSCSFTVTRGATTIRAIRFRMIDAASSAQLLEFFVNVSYTFSSNAIYSIVSSPGSPSNLYFGQSVGLAFSYRTANAGGVRILAQPLTGTGPTLNSVISESHLLAASAGSDSAWFRVESGKATIDSIRFRMYNASLTSLLLEFTVPVKFAVDASSISNVRCFPASPEGLLLSEDVALSFDYHAADAEGVLIRTMLTASWGSVVWTSPSPVYPGGSGTGTGKFYAISGWYAVEVSQVTLQMTTLDSSQTLYECAVPVSYYCTENKICNVRLSPSSPAYFTSDANGKAFFDYTSTESTSVYIGAFPRDPTGSFSSSMVSMSICPPGSGSGESEFGFSGAHGSVRSLTMEMDNGTLPMRLYWDYPVDFTFGNTSLTGVKEPASSVPTTISLEQNYPNPFNPKTVVGFQLPVTGRVRLAVYDILGRAVATLMDGQQEPGRHEVTFDATGLASGVYLYQLSSGPFVTTKKMVFVK